MKLTIICLILTLLLWAIACTEGSESPPTAPTEITEPTPNVQATVEAGIASTREAEASIEATITARVEATKAAAPTATPQPSPTPTSQPTPTQRPQPTATPHPTPTAVPTTTERQLTGNWYRNADWEHSLTLAMKEIDPGTAYEIRVATLDAPPESPDQDLALSLGCVGPTQVAYLTPYSGEILDYVDSYVFGIWDVSEDAYLDGHVHFYYSPILTDDGASIYITNNAQLRQILATVAYAAGGLQPEQSLLAGA